MNVATEKYIDELIGKILVDFSCDEKEKKVVGDFLLPHDFPAFSGHFPGEPVLPAVVQLAFVRFLVAKAKGRKCMPVRLDRIKFSGMLRPGDKAVVSLTMEEKGCDLITQFNIVCIDEKIASGSILFTLGEKYGFSAELL